MTDSGCGILVRIQDRKGALERVLGLLRRKALTVRTSSLSRGHGGILELFLREDPQAPPSSRIRPELSGLVDVLDVQELGETGQMITREMVLMRVLPGSGPLLPDLGRIVAEGPEGDVLEVTGTPAEVNAAIAEMKSRSLLASFRRTGEIPAPNASIHARGVPGG